MLNENELHSELSEEDQLVAQRASEYLIDFEIATDPLYDPNWHHEVIAGHLEHIEKYGAKDYKIIIITVPPRHGKSRQCSIDFPAWYLGKNPRKEIIISSYSGDLAEDFGSKTRDRVDSFEYKVIFPNVRLKPDQKAKGKWGVQILENEKWKTVNGGYTASGVGGAITGRGADVFIIDDPVKNAEEADSQVYRDKVWDWFTSTAFTRLHPGGVCMIIMTRWHVDDLAGRIIAEPEFKDMVKVVKLPAIATKDGKYRKQGDALWKSKYPLSELEQKKIVSGPYVWSSLYQCSPILTEKQEFKPEWLKLIDEEEVASKQTDNILTIDTAMSKKTQADYCGFCDNAIDREGFWNIKAWRSRLGPDELVENIFALHERRKYTAIGIEKTAYTEGLKPFLDAEQRRRGRFLPIVELHHSQISKETRVRGLIPLYSSGTIRHIEGFCDALEEEQMQFPNGIHDDVLDAVAYQLQMIDKKEKRGVKVRGNRDGGYTGRFNLRKRK